MRLVCPNCDAQYEVPDDVIPPEGRDVQCSNCGSTWFQAHPDTAPAAEEDLSTSEETPQPEEEWTPEVPADEPLAETAPEAPEPNHNSNEDGPVTMAADAPDAVLAEAVKAALRRARPGATVEITDIPEKDEPTPAIAQADQDFEDELDEALGEIEADAPKVEPEAAASDVDEAKSLGKAEDEIYFEPTQDEPEEPVEHDTPPRRTIDPTVAGILQEEAALEAEKRAEETNLESQPDLGLEEQPLDDAAKRAKQARDRMARMRGLSPDAAGQPAQPVPENSRRDLLPDIEEINSTLRATEDRMPEEQPDGRPTPSQRRAGGRRMGFALALLLIAAGALIYTNSETVSDTIPGSSTFVSAFVNGVDSVRLGLDAQMTKLMLWLDGLSSEG
ncbi:MAG: zinc-ribbon domain-containing protein [Pseudomonadota bacterium]|nr:zinc-ribbon domain-containing protein [Pseudomonadota bacterium]